MPPQGMAGMEILTWKEDWQDPVVERDEREPDDGRGEEVEEVLQQLNGDVVRRKGLLVDVGRVEIRDDRIVRGRVSRDGRLEDGVEPLVDGCVGQPEHGAHEEVEEILRLDYQLLTVLLCGNRVFTGYYPVKYSSQRGNSIPK